MNNYIDIEAMTYLQQNVVFTANQAMDGNVKVPSEYLMNIDYVKDAIVLYNGETAIVSVLTTPIYMTSIRNKVTDEIIDAVKSNLNDAKIIVSYDTDIYFKAGRVADIKDFDNILNLISERS